MYNKYLIIRDGSDPVAKISIGGSVIGSCNKCQKLEMFTYTEAQCCSLHLQFK